jgi:hypothetical protein
MSSRHPPLSILQLWADLFRSQPDKIVFHARVKRGFRLRSAGSTAINRRSRAKGKSMHILQEYYELPAKVKPPIMHTTIEDKRDNSI